MATYTKEQLLKVLDNLSGPVEGYILKDILTSMLDITTAGALGEELDDDLGEVYASLSGSTLTGDNTYGEGFGPVIIDSVSGSALRLSGSAGSIVGVVVE